MHCSHFSVLFPVSSRNSENFVCRYVLNTNVDMAHSCYKNCNFVSHISVSSKNLPFYAVHPHFKSTVQLAADVASDSVMIDHTVPYKCLLDY